jgi:hypothetical protein
LAELFGRVIENDRSSPADTETPKGVVRPPWVIEIPAVHEYLARAGHLEHVAVKSLPEEILYAPVPGMEPVPSEIEPETVSFYGPGQAADRIIPLDNCDRNARPGQQTARREAGEAGAENRDIPGAGRRPKFRRRVRRPGDYSAFRFS